MKSLFTYLMIFIFASCSQNKSIQTDLRACINNVVNEYAQDNYGKNPIDFYDLMMEIEQKILFYNLIDDKKIRNYKQLFTEIIEEKNDIHEEFYSEAVSLMDKKGFDFNLYVINNAIYSKCPYDVLTKMENYKMEPFYEYGFLLDRTMTNGFDNKEIIDELLATVSENNFAKVHYRAPIILLILLNIDRKINPLVPIEKIR